MFFRNIGSLLVELINHSFEVGELSSSQKQAMTVLIGKTKKSNKRLIKNWRPIVTTFNDKRTVVINNNAGK